MLKYLYFHTNVIMFKKKFDCEKCILQILKEFLEERFLDKKRIDLEMMLTNLLIAGLIYLVTRNAICNPRI